MTSTAIAPAPQAEVKPEPQPQPTARTYDRFTSVVAGKACTATCANGHITKAAAESCGKRRVKGTKSVATLGTVDRFQGVKADGTDCTCKFGHKTRDAALACVGVRPPAPAKKGAAKKAPATKAADKPTATAPRKSRLRSSAEGNTGRA